LSWRRPRRLLFLCALLDLASVWPLAALADRWVGSSLLQRPLWLLSFGAGYLLLGWLLGSYTVLRWPGLRLPSVLRRLLTTSAVTLLAVILVRWVFNLPVTFTLGHRSTLVLLLAPMTLWSLLVRLLLRRLSEGSRWQLMVPEASRDRVALEWQRQDLVTQPHLLSPKRLCSSSWSRRSLRLRGLALAADLQLGEEERRELGRLQASGLTVTSLESLAAHQLERLPPTLLPDDWLVYEAIPWSDEFSLQRKLKRVADVALAMALLLLTAPLLLVLATLIWLEDRGPVLYRQERSGWMGGTFQLLKLRTMVVAPPDVPATWTMPGDRRITRMGSLLRPSRLDELPQLINVLRGEMSLIGPRPERPELEQELEASIPHYRKRHWMPPGLSGWAQVCAPYAASLEEAELKLSYDLYYLRNWSMALDLLILFKTIKTVLKVGGR
jgi:lipopolysaccharide/colanic/teichoic acid biosynthesis glycosyltransferase